MITAADSTAMALVADVMDEAAMEGINRVTMTWSRIDILYNNVEISVEGAMRYSKTYRLLPLNIIDVNCSARWSLANMYCRSCRI